MSKTWDDVVKQAMYMYCHRDEYVYFYGAKGQRLTDDTMKALVNAEPKHFSKYTDSEMNEIYNNSRGKIGFDCSGFVCACTGLSTYSTALINGCELNPSIAAGPDGSLLYSTFNGTGRHIGIDIGHGYFMHMGSESTNANIAAHKDSVRFEKVSEMGSYWEKSGKHKSIDYSTVPYSSQESQKEAVKEEKKEEVVIPTTETKTVKTALYLRQGAGVSNKSICVMPQGAIITLTGERQNGWCKVLYNGVYGWCNESYLK